MPAGGILRSVKKYKENSNCLFEGNFLNFIVKNNLVLLIFLPNHGQILTKIKLLEINIK